MIHNTLSARVCVVSVSVCKNSKHVLVSHGVISVINLQVSDPDRGDNKIPTFRYLPTVPISLPKSLPSDMVDVDKSNGTVKLLKQLELTNNSMFSIIVRIKSKNEYIGSDVTYRNQKIFLKIQVLYIQ